MWKPMGALFPPQNAPLPGTAGRVLHKALANEPADQRLAAEGDFDRAADGETLPQAQSAGRWFGSADATYRDWLA